MAEKTLGEIAYEAYQTKSVDTPEWAALTGPQQAAWQAAADAVAAEDQANKGRMTFKEWAGSKDLKKGDAGWRWAQIAWDAAKAEYEPKEEAVAPTAEPATTVQ